MCGDLDGRTALVTGGGSGIGLATAKVLAREGAAVALLDIDEKRAERAASEIRNRGARAHAVVADVTDWGAVLDAVEKAQSELGPIDGLVNNAGIAQLGSVHEINEQQWDGIMAVNVKAVFLVSKALLPAMMARRKGAIVNIGSVAGIVGIAKMAAYCASKGAITNLTRQMAVDYAQWGIRINAVAAGTVATTEMGSMLLKSDETPEAKARRLAKYPMGRFGEPNEIAETVAFLLGEKASFISGAIVAVDGAMTAV